MSQNFHNILIFTCNKSQFNILLLYFFFFFFDNWNLNYLEIIITIGCKTF